MGSLAYKLALVAAGRFDGLISLRASHDWDLAAAALLIGEAGGRISGADGAPLILNQRGGRPATPASPRAGTARAASGSGEAAASAEPMRAGPAVAGGSQALTGRRRRRAIDGVLQPDATARNEMQRQAVTTGAEPEYCAKSRCWLA